MPYTYKLEKPQKVRLDAFKTDETWGLTQEEAEERLSELTAELAELQELLFGAGQQAVLVVLQGRDTSGKDGTLKHVFGPLNAQGCRAVPFKVPTEEELAHDFLWRIHRQTPRRGEIVVFNRSHYEDVLVVRVHQLVPEPVWRARFDHINHFEQLLADNHTLLLKFFLHISRKEQKERLLEREKEVKKAWKLSVGDWQERERWDAYTEAYEEALGRCATPQAPWHIVPADRKWVRNLAVAEAVVQALRPYRQSWEAVLAERGEQQKQALAEYRRQAGR